MAGSVLRAFCCRSAVNSSSDNGSNDSILTGVNVSLLLNGCKVTLGGHDPIQTEHLLIHRRRTKHRLAGMTIEKISADVS